MGKTYGAVVGNCQACGQEIGVEHPYAWCAECGQPLPQDVQARLARTQARQEAPRAASGRRVQFQVFRGILRTWEGLFTDAAEFASRLPPEDVISISHSAEGTEGIVTVWYWTGAAG